MSETTIDPIPQFDTLPITVPGVYQYRCDEHGEGEIIVMLTRSGAQLMTGDGLVPFEGVARNKGAGWYFKRSDIWK